MPVFAMAAVLADWLVRILFGPSWAQAVPLVALFSVSAAYLPVLMAASLLYMTQGRMGELLRATLIDAALYHRRHPRRPALGRDRRGSLDRRCRCAGPSAGRLLAGDAPWSGVDGRHHDSHRAGGLCRGHGRHRRVVGAHAALGEAPTVGGVLLLGFCGLVAIGLAVLAWPETRSEVARLSMTARSKGRALWSS